jgi:hypothetical protein
MESAFQSGSGPRERLGVNMSVAHFPTIVAEVPAYAQLQWEMHDSLLAQHPEWILPNGDSPTCDSYDARFAEILLQTLPTRPPRPKQGIAFQFQFAYPSTVAMAH